MKDKHHKSQPAAAPAPEAPVETPAAPAPIPEAAVLKDQLLHLQADFDNYRKRITRDQADLAQRAAENLIQQLLPALDHFEIGLKSASETEAGRSVANGFRMVFAELMTALQKAGVTTLEGEGQPFDPQIHEAVTHLPSDTVPAEHVLSQIRRGYQLGKKLLRPSQVVVSSGPAQTAASLPAQPDVADADAAIEED